jgi:hypothetical protein
MWGTFFENLQFFYILIADYNSSKNIVLNDKKYIMKIKLEKHYFP